jgi:hypothetical protein
MTPIHIKLTEELIAVLAKISDHAADDAVGPLLAEYPHLRKPQIGPLIEALLRSHPAVDIVREELGVEWLERTTRGWKRGVPRKKVLKPTRKRKT